MYRLTLKPGYGYWDTTAYPIGGNFRRAPKSEGITFEVTKELPKATHGANIVGTIVGTDTKIACDSQHCERA